MTAAISCFEEDRKAGDRGHRDRGQGDRETQEIGDEKKVCFNPAKGQRKKNVCYFDAKEKVFAIMLVSKYCGINSLIMSCRSLFPLLEVARKNINIS